MWVGVWSGWRVVARFGVVGALAVLVVAFPAAGNADSYPPASVEAVVAEAGVVYAAVEGSGFSSAPFDTYVSDDGGMTWSQIRGIPPTSLDSHMHEFEVRMAVRCLESTPEHCFRISGRGGRIEETVDGGGTWQRSWEPSPRFGSYPAPRDLAVMSDSLFVVFGTAGIVTRNDSGEWTSRSVGPVPAPETPTIFHPRRSPLIRWIWTVWVSTLVLVAATVLNESVRQSTSDEDRGRFSVAVVGSMVVFGGVILMTTGAYPFAFAAFPVVLRAASHLAVVAVPVAVSVLAIVWLDRRAGDRDVVRAIVLSLVSGVVTWFALSGWPPGYD